MLYLKSRENRWAFCERHSLFFEKYIEGYRIKTEYGVKCTMVSPLYGMGMLVPDTEKNYA